MLGALRGMGADEAYGSEGKMNRQGDVSFNRGSVPCVCPQELEVDAGTIDHINLPNLSTRARAPRLHGPSRRAGFVCGPYGVSKRRRGHAGAVRVHDDPPRALYSAAAGRDLRWPVGREELQKLDVRRQRINLWVIYLAVLGVAIGILENELLWHNRNIPVMSFQLMKLMNSGVTLFLFYMILQ